MAATEGGIAKQRSYNRLPAKKRMEVWQAYLALGAILAVAQSCKVSAVAVTSLAEKGDWERRRADILRRAEEKIGSRFERWAGDLIPKIDALLAQAEERVKISDRFDVSDLDKLVRLRSFLSGGPDSRQEVTNPHEGDAADKIRKLRGVFGALDPKERGKVVEICLAGQRRLAAANGGAKPDADPGAPAED